MKIMLACNAGMSTSMVVVKMQEAAASQGKKYKIWAVDVNSVEDELGKFDVLLIGPQIQYKLKKKKKLVDDKVPVSIINPVSYGTCNGAEILSQAEKMFEDFRKEK